MSSTPSGSSFRKLARQAARDTSSPRGLVEAASCFSKGEGGVHKSMSYLGEPESASEDAHLSEIRFRGMPIQKVEAASCISNEEWGT